MNFQIIRSIAAVLAFCFLTCDNPANNDDDRDLPGNEFISCSIDGTKKEFNDFISVQVQKVTQTAPVTINITGINGNQASGSTFNIFVNGATVTTYNPGGPLVYSEIKADPVIYSTFKGSTVHSVITLTRCDPPGGIIEGTFKGTAFDSSGDSISISDGKFRVKRPAGADSGGLTQMTFDTLSLTYDSKTYVWRSKNSDGTAKDLVSCSSISMGVAATTVIASRIPGPYEMVTLTWTGPVQGSYTLGQEEVGTLVFQPRQLQAISAVVDECTDDEGMDHKINAPVTLTVSTSSGRVRGTFSGLVINSDDKCPFPTKGISGSFSIALNNYLPF